MHVYLSSKIYSMKQLLVLPLLLIAFISFGQVPNYVPTNGLVGYWPFNGNANDESGNGNNGTNNGATLTTDRFGNANSAYGFVVDGSVGWGAAQQYIDVPYSSVFNSGVMTCSGWVYPEEKPSPYDNRPLTIFSRWNDASPNFRFQVTYGNEVQFQLYDNLGTSHIVLMGNVPFNEWSFVLCTYDGNECRIYLNGVLIHSELLGIQLMQGPSNLTIAQTKMPNGNWYFFDGTLDDLGYWNRALSESEIQQLYASCTSPITLNSIPDQSSCARGSSYSNSQCNCAVGRQSGNYQCF